MSGFKFNETVNLESRVSSTASNIERRDSYSIELSHSFVRIYDGINSRPVRIDYGGLVIPFSSLVSFENSLRSAFVPFFSADCRISITTKSQRVF